MCHCFIGSAILSEEFVNGWVLQLLLVSARCAIYHGWHSEPIFKIICYFSTLCKIQLILSPNARVAMSASTSIMYRFLPCELPCVLAAGALKSYCNNIRTTRGELVRIKILFPMLNNRTHQMDWSDSTIYIFLRKGMKRKCEDKSLATRGELVRIKVLYSTLNNRTHQMDWSDSTIYFSLVVVRLITTNKPRERARRLHHVSRPLVMRGCLTAESPGVANTSIVIDLSIVKPILVDRSHVLT
ncbi:hypothetical protein NQ317_008012 [Molorchus minor]|uniref:Uncharacterized protein n=1 Tax=Molorchus minor TaxID=1323400 RepID=A0ABQ9JY51_9CUCU|nr:hypothetical protein NQ317_008012 [Molorchus minor]